MEGSASNILSIFIQIRPVSSAFVVGKKNQNHKIMHKEKQKSIF